VFVDFDGTITDVDTFDVLTRRFGGDEAWDQTERRLRDGTMSVREALDVQASLVRGSFEEVSALIAREVRVDPSFASFVAACREHGLEVTVVSSGIDRIVRNRLESLGLGDLPVVANGVEISAGAWRIQFRDAAANGTDKAGLVRAAQAAGTRVVFIGDGRSDFDAALCADRRFAKRDLPLARYLRERKAAFEAFSAFVEIVPVVPHFDPARPGVAGGVERFASGERIAFCDAAANGTD